MSKLGFDDVFSEKKEQKAEEKIVMTIDKGKDNEDQRYSMKLFEDEREVLNYVSNMSAGDVKVHKIFILNHEGQTRDKTIAFKNGQLELVDVKKD
jgi:hypothetical protein